MSEWTNARAARGARSWLELLPTTTHSLTEGLNQASDGCNSITQHQEEQITVVCVIQLDSVVSFQRRTHPQVTQTAAGQQVTRSASTVLAQITWLIGFFPSQLNLHVFTPTDVLQLSSIIRDLPRTRLAPQTIPHSFMSGTSNQQPFHSLQPHLPILLPPIPPPLRAALPAQPAPPNPVRLPRACLPGQVQDPKGQEAACD